MSDKDEELFLASLPVIDAAVAFVCRRHRLAAAEAEEFASEVRLHFIERHYEPLRRFEGRCTLRAYLVVVVNHLFLDYRNKQWGKWRPTAEAMRLGPTAIRFEQLVVRDGWSVDQAIEMLRTQLRVGEERIRQLAPLCLRIAERLPGREVVAENEAERVESEGPAPDANVVRAEQVFYASRVTASLERALQKLSAEDRLIIRMRMDGISVADIARALHHDQKRLYKTIDRLYAELRRRLEADGFAHGEVSPLFGSGAFDDDDDPGEGSGVRSGGGPQSGSPAPAAMGIGGRRG